MSTDLVEGTVSTLNSSENDDDPLTNVSADDGPPLPLDLLQRTEAVISLDGQVILRVAEDDTRRLVLLAKTCPADLDMTTWLFIATDWLEDENFAIALNIEINGCQMLLPRYHPKPSSTKVLLTLESNIVFPLLVGDLLNVRVNGNDICNLKLKIPKLSRSTPSSDSEKQTLNAAHYLRHIALEISHQPPKCFIGQFDEGKGCAASRLCLQQKVLQQQ